MTRLHQTKARADIYEEGLRTPAKNKQGFTLDRSKPANKKDKVIVKKGETYYWWQFAYSAKQISLSRPKNSQLTRSGYQAAIFDLQDRIQGLLQISEPDDFLSEVEDIKSELESLRDEQEEKKSNMPESLQESGSGELLQERYDSLDSAIGEFDSIDTDYNELEDSDKEEGETDEEFDERRSDHKSGWLSEKCDEVSNISLE